MIVFLAIFPPPPLLATHAFNVFLFLKNFPPLLGNPCFQWFSFYEIFPPPPPPACLLGNPCFQWFSFFSKIFPPPFLGNPCFQWFSFYQNFPLPFLGNPCFQCFQWFSFYQFFSPPLRLGNPCFEWFASLPRPAPCFENLCSQWFSFDEFFLPPFLATLAFNHFLFIKFLPSWHPMLSRMLFLSNFFSPSPPPPSWQPMLSMFFFLSKISPPPSWQPMLSMIFFLSICSHPFLATSGPGFLEEGSSIDFHPWNLTANIHLLGRHIQPSFWISLVCLLLPRQSGANPNECEARWGIRRIILYQKLTFQTWSRHNTFWHLFIIPFGNSWKHHDSKYWNVLGTCPGKSRCIETLEANYIRHF